MSDMTPRETAAAAMEDWLNDWSTPDSGTDAIRALYDAGLTVQFGSVATGQGEDEEEGAEKQPGTFYELAVLRRFADGGRVDLATVQQQVGALLRALPPAAERGEGDETPFDFFAAPGTVRDPERSRDGDAR
jgi:hypothetical protein